RQLPKLNVVGSNPITRSNPFFDHRRCGRSSVRGTFKFCPLSVQFMQI
ncbi:MAG: hypothetical protein ACI807_003835, partial [Paracoccaceae bacterium]